MPALICLSPVLAIHSFPRSPHELKRVAAAIGGLAARTEDGTVRVVRTEFFEVLLQEFSWVPDGGLKGQIYQHLHLWFMQGGKQTIRVNVSAVGGVRPHAIPKGCRDEAGLVDLWAEELGNLFVVHSQCIDEGQFFIGVACDFAFAGENVNTYETESGPNCFPLVGPSTCDCASESSLLCDAFAYEIPAWVRQARVSFAEARKNAWVIGASRVDKPSGAGGSHFMVRFPGKRSWPLDPNNDPLPELYLKELVGITGYPYPAIVYALKEGCLPPMSLRLPNHSSAA